MCYSVARAELMPSVEHHPQKYQNNRTENSPQPTKSRERVMRWFKSPGHAERFLGLRNHCLTHFQVGRHPNGKQYRAMMKLRFAGGDEAICVEAIVD